MNYPGYPMVTAEKADAKNTYSDFSQQTVLTPLPQTLHFLRCPTVHKEPLYVVRVRGVALLQAGYSEEETPIRTAARNRKERADWGVGKLGSMTAVGGGSEGEGLWSERTVEWEE